MQNLLSGGSVLISSIAASSVATFDAANNVRAIMFTAGMASARCGIYVVAVASGGGVSCYPLIQATDLSVDTSETRKLKLTNNSAAVLNVMFFMLSDRKIEIPT